MKETYVAPEMEVIRFESEDVITTSGIIDTGINDNTNDNLSDILK